MKAAHADLHRRSGSHRGRKTEVDNYNGFIAMKGREQGVATPVNTRLTLMVHEIEAGTRQIIPANFNDIPL